MVLCFMVGKGVDLSPPDSGTGGNKKAPPVDTGGAKVGQDFKTLAARL